MAENLNPGDKTVADADYEKKFNKQPKSAEAKSSRSKKLLPMPTGKRSPKQRSEVARMTTKDAFASLVAGPVRFATVRHFFLSSAS